MKDTIRCNNGEVNLSGYNYKYWNSWQLFVQNHSRNNDIEMIKHCLCYFYIEWMTTFDMEININTIIANAVSVTDEQIANRIGRRLKEPMFLDLSSMSDYDPINTDVGRYIEYILEWMFHTTPEIARNIIDYISPDMNERLSRLATSMYSYYVSMKLLDYNKRDKDSDNTSITDILTKLYHINGDKKEEENG